MRLEFHPEAAMELSQAAEFYELQIPGLRDRFAAEVERATDILCDQPLIGRPANWKLRQFTLRRFPFTLYYSATDECVRIEAVAHQRRRPRYWEKRFWR